MFRRASPTLNDQQIFLLPFNARHYSPAIGAKHEKNAAKKE
jgi:hypothetical protein